ncbi:IclR family transcriptional regulator C-terminal domain-containing protein [Streptomyces sp. NPDC048297]|uniref:IclR family transcriptional regulator domain-containing protein n=1 Tax=Streptomyces sp. NPDC048297 TaxID=3365531 RepID=UPI003715B09E
MQGTNAAVGPLERGLGVLRALARAPGGRLRRSDLVRLTGLARSPVDRIATTLARLGHLREEGDRDLVVAPRLLELGLAYLHACRIPETLGPLAARLADELDESVSLAVPDGDAARFVVQTPRRRALSVTFRVGDALPAELCAPGALFAGDWDEGRFAHWRQRLQDDPADSAFPALPPLSGRTRPSDADFRARAARAREDGWSVDDQLVEPGLIAVAVPVRDADGRTVAALSVASHTSRHSAESLREHTLEPLRRTAGQMRAALAEPPAPPAVPAPDRDASRDPKEELGPEYLQSLARGLAVLTALAAPGGMTLTEVAEATALPRATARRSLLTLQQLGYVAADGNRFTPLPRVLDLGYATLSSLTLPEVAQPHLVDLVLQVHESASVAVLDGGDIRYVARVAASRIMRVDISVGTHFPAHATSMGRVLLAGLQPEALTTWLAGIEPKALTARTETDPNRLARAIERTRRDGFALVEQELEEGLRSIAVPLRTPDGRTVAAVNVSLHAGRTTTDDILTRILPALRRTARRIDADLALVLALG